MLGMLCRFSVAQFVINDIGMLLCAGNEYHLMSILDVGPYCGSMHTKFILYLCLEKYKSYCCLKKQEKQHHHTLVTNGPFDI